MGRRIQRTTGLNTPSQRKNSGQGVRSSEEVGSLVTGPSFLYYLLFELAVGHLGFSAIFRSSTPSVLPSVWSPWSLEPWGSENLFIP